MTEEEVSDIFGSPYTRKVSETGGLEIVETTYKLESAGLSAQYVSGVLVKFSLNAE